MPALPVPNLPINAYLIFDHRDDWNYKFAGLQASSGRWVIGAVHGWVETILASASATLPQADRWYTLDLVVELNKVTLYADGADTVTWTRAGGQVIGGGRVGVAVRGGAARFQELEQWDIASVTKTYTGGGQRVAMRKDGVLYYLLTDHLGSTSVVIDENGGVVAQLRYKPFGEPRGPASTAPTDRQFTGQRAEVGLGSLYDYGARHYSPALGRFISADTIVPSPGDPQSLNRYSYVYNRPTLLTDPSGHCPVCIIIAAALVAGYELLAVPDTAHAPSLDVNIAELAPSAVPVEQHVANMAINSVFAYVGVTEAKGMWDLWRYQQVASRQAESREPAVGMPQPAAASPGKAPNPQTGVGYGVDDPPVRLGRGQWSDADMQDGLRGRPPQGLGRPDLHHADQMPGSAIHEVLPAQHQGNPALHPNGAINQGVTPVMRVSDRMLHWWYRGILSIIRGATLRSRIGPAVLAGRAQ